MNRIADSFNIMQNTLSSFIKETQFVVTSAVQGDLSKRVKLDNKKGYSKRLAEMLNELMMVCQKLIREIKTSTNTINVAAKEISSGSADLAKRTENQAASLQETSASLEQLTSTVKQNAESAKQANQYSITATEIANHGGTAVKNVVQTMGNINASSRKVADIISVIDGIAFQTNILALNAAVEAARAGEQGRGFAVVATEVRNLAQRSATAAKEIKELIVDSVDKIENGSKQVDEAGARMEEIVQAIQKVAGIMMEITSASMQQSTGIEQVNQAVSQMDGITQQNAALANKEATTARVLEEQTQHMIELVAAFKIGDDKMLTSHHETPAQTDQEELSLAELTAKYDVEEKEKRSKKQPGTRSESDEEWKEF
ncbi:MAG: chemotaxis protein [Gammaproteobacteria bacterium]|nr:MAG: chemotaxis protein [Gammaproteobacteria bacterium]